MNDLTILLDAGYDRGAAGTCVDHVRVSWENLSSTLPDYVRTRIDSKWAEYVSEAEAQGRRLFNGPVSQMKRVQRLADGTAELGLGPSEYKSFLVTCVRDRKWFEEHAPAAKAPALGNSALLTRGDSALLGIRSRLVGLYPGRAHLIGGVLDELGTLRFPASTRGLIAHLLMELHEEAGVLPDDLAPLGGAACMPRLLGVAHEEFLGQPEAFWQWETCTPLEEIAQRFTAEEHDGGMLLQRTGLTADQWNAMTPVARQAWHIWSGETGDAF